jgi:hypothetical protein
MSVFLPVKQPAEKLTSVINVRCTDVEKSRWIERFGGRDMSATVRRLLNAAAAKKLKRKSV